MTTALTKALYGLFAITCLGAGLSVVLLNTGVLPGAVREMLLAAGQNNGHTLHIMQEFGTVLVFVGLITLWFVRHFDQSRPFHWAVTLFLGLFALVHWFDVRDSSGAGIGPVINTVPFAVFLVVGLLRLRSERPAPSKRHQGDFASGMGGNAVTS